MLKRYIALALSTALTMLFTFIIPGTEAAFQSMAIRRPGTKSMVGTKRSFLLITKSKIKIMT
jgi:hypothetical protein